MGARGNYLLLGVLMLCGVASPWVGGISPYYFDILIHSLKHNWRIFRFRIYLELFFALFF